MERDLVQLATAMLRPLNLNRAQIRAVAERLIHGIPTLAVLIAPLPPDQVAEIKRKYKQGWQVLLNGLQPEHGLPGMPGFADRPIDDLITPNVTSLAALYQQHVQADQAEKDKTRPGGPFAGRGPRDGYRAAGQVVYAARQIVALLLQHGKITGTPLAGLKVPPGPGPARDRALTLVERRQWCRIVVLHDPDPVLAAITWILWVMYGLRDVEVERLKEVDLNVARACLVVVGKGGGRRELPLHRPLARFIHDVMAARPHAPNGQLLRSPTGHPVTGRTWDRWSVLLRKHAPWAQGFRIGPYALRHTAARQPRKHGYDTAATGRLLGHTPRETTATYTFDWTDLGTWDDAVDMIEALYGPLDGWPHLPENDVLGPVLGLDLPLPPPPTGLAA